MGEADPDEKPAPKKAATITSDTIDANMIAPIDLVVNAYGLQAGTLVHELAMRDGAVLHNVVVQDVIVAGYEAPALMAMRVQEEGAKGSYLVPWHSVVFVRV